MPDDELNAILGGRVAMPDDGLNAILGGRVASYTAHRPTDTGALVDRARRLPAAIVLAAAGVALWLILDPRTPDLAGQVYRAGLFQRVGFAVWDTHWYAGHYLPSYSLVFPPLAAWFGVRTVGAVAVLASTVLFEAIVRRARPARARGAAAWFALGALGDVWSGRVTFALGVTLALAAVWAASTRGRGTRAGALVAVGCAATSPVAGLLLAMAGVSDALARRSSRSLLVLALPAFVVAVLLSVLFGDGGWEPYPTVSFLATAAVIVGFLLAVPREERLLRLGALVYLAACVASLAIHTPMGSNVERYGVLLAGPLLVLVLPAARGIRAAGIGLLLVGIATWTVWGPVRETAAVSGNASTSAAYYAPVERFLRAHGGSLVRVEVPFTRGHWEAAWLARSFSLARGWEKQLDTRYDKVLLSPRLDAAGYQEWLRDEAVGYVALPDTPLDPSSAREGRLIESGLTYLREVFRDREWRIYRVLGARPIAEGPGRLTSTTNDSLSILFNAAGRLLIREHYTRYWQVTAGDGCVGRAPGGWTYVRASAPGALRVTARFSLARAFGGGSEACSGGR